MNMRYAAIPSKSTQEGTEASFIGGRPRLPGAAEVPRCTLCECEQTFYFQVAFPPGHRWHEYTLAVFACTSCAVEDSLIPEMPSGKLAGADVSLAFLQRYQRNFRFLVFETPLAKLVESYREAIEYRRLTLVAGASSAFGFVGGAPEWLGEDETPAALARESVVFLMQLMPDYEFDIVAGAPRQMEISLRGIPERSQDPFYRLFIGNASYLFGAEHVQPDSVYALTQVG